MPTTKRTILITAGRSYITLDLARKLAAVGHRVVIADSMRYHLSQASNAVAKSYSVPSPRFQPSDFVDALCEIVRHEGVDLLIPVGEEIFAIAERLERFPSRCQVFASPMEKLLPLHNKWLFNQKLKDYGLTVPRTVLLRNAKDLEALDFGATYALKPSYSRGSMDLYRLRPGDPLPAIVIRSRNPWIAQEWVDGKQYCSYSVCREGKVCAHVVYPVEVAIDGHSCLSFRVEEHPGILEWVQRFAELENFTGQIAFDFIESPDGVLYPIECNPRATSGVHLFGHGDRLDQAFLGDKPALQLAKQCTVPAQIFSGMLLYGWNSPFSRRAPLKYLKGLFTHRDIIFSWRDLKPALMAPLLLVQYWRLASKLGQSLSGAFLHDHQWNAESG